MLKVMAATLVILAVLAGWVAVQHIYRRFARRYPQLGPYRNDGQSCGGSCGGRPGCGTGSKDGQCSS